jgi:hypothetical protein
MTQITEEEKKMMLQRLKASLNDNPLVKEIIIRK